MLYVNHSHCFLFLFRFCFVFFVTKSSPYTLAVRKIICTFNWMSIPLLSSPSASKLFPFIMSSAAQISNSNTICKVGEFGLSSSPVSLLNALARRWVEKHFTKTFRESIRQFFMSALQCKCCEFLLPRVPICPAETTSQLLMLLYSELLELLLSE